MRLGIISDTHGESWTTQRAVRLFEALNIDELLHCGDVGTPEIVHLLAKWPSHYVLGNMDDHVLVREAIERLGQTCYERFGHLHRAGRSIAFLHGDDAELLRRTILCGRWNLVCHGHTHVAADFVQGATQVINPGAIQRTGHPSVAVIDLPSMQITSVPV